MRRNNYYSQEAEDNGKTKEMYPILPTGITQGAGSKTYRFRITLPDTCTWTLTTESKWIHPAATEGKGSATVSCTVTAVTAASVGRTGEIVFVYTSPSATKKITVPVDQLPLVWPVGGSQYKAGEIRMSKDAGRDADSAKGDVVTGVGAISSFYGERFTAQSKYRSHGAIDIDVDNNNTATEVYAAMRGRIVKIGKNDGISGNYVHMEHTAVGEDGTTATLYTHYLHLYRISEDIKEGDFIEAGTVIGIVGHTGSSEGDTHLHFAVLKKIGTQNYRLNPVAYYHGCDDRGSTRASDLQACENNPMFVLRGNTWVKNFHFDPLYRNFNKASDAFYEKFMNAHRDGDVNEEADEG